MLRKVIDMNHLFSADGALHGISQKINIPARNSDVLLTIGPRAVPGTPMSVQVMVINQILRTSAELARLLQRRLNLLTQAARLCSFAENAMVVGLLVRCPSGRGWILH